ncbi:uncharacterized protein K460DRAFT_65028 [Cucurbitaria berberidis CBS 394.84]|uniref:Secreted protein n=1 Tax=Cucurbitaria berberidis CBS 394.84 TaxID=1168544 RepID=A0A9P4GLP0_9PLEO|nr:uncharacterized protein K460DRAFT_65028 [Cucurbitaria berberidis CBS 394.84]KAF1847875.1 hypothetical protein K460DRAFT_65028 [Cucurbitaria berberidis CBS 394.84]
MVCQRWMSIAALPKMMVHLLLVSFAALRHPALALPILKVHLCSIADISSRTIFRRTNATTPSRRP